MNEGESTRHRENLENLLEELSKSCIPLEVLLEDRDFQWSKIPHDEKYVALLEAKTKELYDTIYNDPFNGMQKYFPYRFDKFGNCGKLWWMSLVHKAQVIKAEEVDK